MTIQVVKKKHLPNKKPMSREGVWEQKPSRDSEGTRPLQTLLLEAGYNPADWGLEENPLITGLADNSQKVAPGNLFVALKGANADGHVFIPDALEKGAAAVLVEQSPPSLAGVPILRVPDTREALARLAHAFFDQPTKNKLVCGITGTNGKTTTSFLLRSCLEAAGYPTALFGTIEYDLGTEKIKAHNTTPSPLDLARYFNIMTKNGLRAAVMEVSSHAIHQKRIAEIHFTVGIFTNLTRDHLDYHETMLSYKETKWGLFQDYIAKNPEGVAVFNWDDPVGREFTERYKGEKVTYGCDQPADVFPLQYFLNPLGTRILLNLRGTRQEIRTRLIGRFHLQNILAAAAGAWAAGLSPDQIARGIDNLSSVPGRFEYVNEGQPFAVIVDYAHTPDALERLLSSACDFNPGRIIIVFGCGGNRDREKRPLMGAAVARSLLRNSRDFAIITNDNPRGETPECIARQAEEGLLSLPGASGRYEIILDRKAAIRHALSLAGEGDMVLIAGKGHEDYQIVGTQTLPFDDRETAREILKEFGFPSLSGEERRGEK